MKYRGLPGDLRNATAVWGAAHPTPSTCKVTATVGTETCDGDGDGKIEWSNPNSEESMRFWQQLASEGLIEGRYTGVKPDGPPPTPGLNVPMTKLAGVGMAIWWIGTQNGSGGWYPGEHGNEFFVSGMDGTTYWNFLTGGEAQQLDLKFDDGKPSQGKIHSPKPVWNPDCATSNDPLVAEYQLTSEIKGCVLYFLNAQ